MIFFKLDAMGSLLNVVGAAVLAVDALLARRRSLAVVGDHAWDATTSQPDANGEDKRLYRLGSGSYWRAVIGFGLVMAGFAIDLYTKLTLNLPVLWHS